MPNKKAKQRKWDKRKRSAEAKQRKRERRQQLKNLKTQIDLLTSKLALADTIINHLDSQRNIEVDLTAVDLQKLLLQYYEFRSSSL